MPQSHARIVVHLVFSTKSRHPFLTDQIQKELFSYLTGILRGEGHAPIAVGGHVDHVHLLFGLARTQSISKIVEKLKTSSSVWIKTKGGNFADFHWQNGYGAFGISPKEIAEVSHYVQNQKSHHAKLSFQDEYREFLVEYGIDFDEEYVWD
ncbi:MAG: IS200/IS605 family transposase [Armatimonadetes bacterium]|nr:IS200/IS605 family transposase [Armatimonadota bacterium]